MSDIDLKKQQPPFIEGMLPGNQFSMTQSELCRYNLQAACLYVHVRASPSCHFHSEDNNWFDKETLCYCFKY